MAKIKQGILGGFSGKVANVVGTSWKGRAVMKSQPLSVSNPRTEAQQEQRGKFSDIAKLASTILTQFVQPVENPISGNISGYNLFCKDNKAAYDGAGELVPANLACGGGKIINLPSSLGLRAVDNKTITLSWSNAGTEGALRMTDKVYAVVLSDDKSGVYVTSGTATRSSESVNLTLVDGEGNFQEDDDAIVLYACVSADGRDVSVKTAAAEVTLTA